MTKFLILYGMLLAVITISQVSVIFRAVLPVFTTEVAAISSETSETSIDTLGPSRVKRNGGCVCYGCGGGERELGSLQNLRIDEANRALGIKRRQLSAENKFILFIIFLFHFVILDFNLQMKISFPSIFLSVSSVLTRIYSSLFLLSHILSTRFSCSSNPILKKLPKCHPLSIPVLFSFFPGVKREREENIEKE
ncbi:hypothetical protein CRE_02217 [Caenorhabditis remanei]|uniref:Uncharacterized protein n=1 Tax=Caenorhabditis remanei TaxID=31234 RepID=E3LFP8_CAERE|nr:hypothetical protein CRE_02217 [Caenorhabditis remanei]